MIPRSTSAWRWRWRTGYRAEVVEADKNRCASLLRLRANWRARPHRQAASGRGERRNLTITNLGTFGVDAFTPIINTGDTGFWCRPDRREAGYPSRRDCTALDDDAQPDVDHRLIDGAPAAQFLQTVIEIFNFGERRRATETPALNLWWHWRRLLTLPLAAGRRRRHRRKYGLAAETASSIDSAAISRSRAAAFQPGKLTQEATALLSHYTPVEITNVAIRPGCTARAAPSPLASASPS